MYPYVTHILSALCQGRQRLLIGLMLLVGSLPAVAQSPTAITGAERTAVYLPLLQGKRVGLVAHQASVVYHQNQDTIPPAHLLDVLRSHGVDVQRIFCPEHGFRGTQAAGQWVANERDSATGIPIVSLYGKNKKPTPQQLDSIDVLLFDLQDMGVRFYTYISTLHYVMEACATAGLPLIVLDRYNPHVHYVDGPVLDTALRSFVGMHPVPVCYGMTIGEYALMINGEGWLGGKHCRLTVVPMLHFSHRQVLTPAVAPSPNLPNRQAMLLYPSLCLFEGTQVSVGRGTPWPFQVVGSPHFTPPAGHAMAPEIRFIPQAGAAAGAHPPCLGQSCRGLDLRQVAPPSRWDISYLLCLYQGTTPRNKFFLSNGFFDRLAGTTTLRKQIEAGRSQEEIRASWQPALTAFMKVRAKYLLYDDFIPQQ